MATLPQNTTPTSNARPDEQADDARRRPNGHRDDAAARVAEPAQDAAVQSVEAVAGIVGQSQDRALRSVQLWAEMMTRLTPFALFTPFARAAGVRDGDPDPRAAAVQVPVRTWAEGVFDLVDTALAAQRRTVDQVLTTHRQLVGQLLDTGAGLAAAQAAPVRESTSTRATRR